MNFTSISISSTTGSETRLLYNCYDFIIKGAICSAFSVLVWRWSAFYCMSLIYEIGYNILMEQQYVQKMQIPPSQMLGIVLRRASLPTQNNGN